MTTVLIILAIIVIGFIVYKLEKKPKKINLPQAPDKIEPTPTPVAKKTATKKTSAVNVTKGVQKTSRKQL